MIERFPRQEGPLGGPPVATARPYRVLDTRPAETWLAAVAERPAVVRGVDVPGRIDPEVQRSSIDEFRKGEA
jgi:hypothetical protein